MENASKSSDPFPLALVVLDLAPWVKKETVEWLMSRIEGLKSTGGAELKVKMVDQSDSKGVVLLIGSTLDRLLRGAEEAALMKVYGDGNFKPFKYSDRQNFREPEAQLLTTAEMLYIIKFMLDNLRANDEQYVPGQPNTKLSPGKPIIPELWGAKILTKMYPMHNREELENLKEQWKKHSYLISQPVQALRNYFGESVALYFGFLGYFTWGLAFRTLLELFFYVTNLKESGGCVICALYNIIWSTVFLEGWKRRSAELTFKWGTLRQMEGFEQVRAGFEEKVGLHQATVVKETSILSQQRNMNILIKSMPFLIGCLTITSLLITTYLDMDRKAQEHDLQEQSVQSLLLSYAPILAYSAIVEALNKVYLILAKALTERENHRLASTHESYLLAKVLIFYLINNFAIHYYFAFYLRDMKRLADTLSAQLLVHQFMGQFFDTIVPYWLTQLKLIKVDKMLSSAANVGLQLIEKEANLRDSSDGLLEEYLELFIKFGYVTLFSSAYPLAGSFSFLNNVLGIKLESMKFSKVLQRQFPVPSANIGAWQMAFEYLTTLAIITNCGLISLSPEFRQLFSDLPDLHYFLLAVAIEHGFLGMQKFVRLAIPEVPSDIANKLERIEQECRRAIFHNESCR
ncbi:hypothetical protein chiPu_0007739 [Chiloscyllium punctatum]|uniref:Anoctamin n=1 Tax=Chiloscyllium punctatum TaxID=137246 RepID=A0A401SG34_CHIPU|nr:hypothetical protein [Chiloscyllium punctatum]